MEKEFVQLTLEKYEKLMDEIRELKKMKIQSVHIPDVGVFCVGFALGIILCMIALALN